MRKTLLISAMALMVMAVPHFGSAQTDAKAKALLASVTKKMASLKSLRANFALSLIGANGKNNGSKKGTVTMAGEKYKVTLTDQEIICDNKTVWTYSKASNEVQVNTYNPAEQTMSPSKLFSNFYDKEYTYKYVGDRVVGGKKCEVVELTPINKSKGFSKVELAIDKASQTIAGGNIWEKNGNRYQYEVSGFTPNPSVAASTFAWDSKGHPGVEVVDLR